MSADAYRSYLLQEWELFDEDPQRRSVAAEIRRHIAPIRVVADVGCGAGQELLPHLGEAMCLALDRRGEGLSLAREFLTREGATDAAFVRAQAESLPLRAASVDLVISRLVLPYTHVPTAVSEAARVLRPGGGFSAKIHGPWFYLRKLRRGAAGRDRPAIRHALRVLRTGVSFHWTGEHRDVDGMLETFLTIARLRALAAAAELDFVARFDYGNPYTPHLLFRRR